MHDPIDARAVAIGDGSKTVVYVSVVAQGLFENYTKAIRDEAIATSKTPGHTPIDDVVVSANHNESSPDTVGIYGGPETLAVAGRELRHQRLLHGRSSSTAWPRRR